MALSLPNAKYDRLAPTEDRHNHAKHKIEGNDASARDMDGCGALKTGTDAG